MSTLIIFGNTNQYTFANSIVAANNKSLKLFNEALTRICVIHSRESQVKLNGEKEEDKKWIEFLRNNNINRGIFVETVIDIVPNGESFEAFVAYLEFILNGNADNPNLIIDLTNGTSLHKNLLSTASYILDLPHQHMIDIVRLSDLTKSREFIPADILEICYISVPESIQLDNIAYLNLAEVVRYKKVIEGHTNKFVQIEQDIADRKFFEGNLSQSVKLKFQGDRKKDNAIYRIAASSISASVEELITLLINKFVLQNSIDKDDRRTLGEKLKVIRTRIETDTPKSFDLEFFRRFNDFILYLRNTSTHKGATLTDIEKFKADLSVKMSFPFIEFYTDIIYPILNSNEHSEQPKRIKKLFASNVNSNNIFYFGLDGDDTGSKLEEAFLALGDETELRKVSSSITRAIKELSKFIETTFSKDAIVFAAGDDILFKGYFNEQALREMQQKYYDITKLTCSIGFGRTFREVYLALKLAKTEPGKNSIVGIELE